MLKMQYIFMVGFPRSGTTLAQSIVMCDDRVFSFPETHIFTKGMRFDRLPSLISNLWRTWYCFWWVKKNFSDNYIFYSTSKKRQIIKFFNYIEKKAQEKKKTIILEKTPSHLSKIAEISKIFSNALFIHVVRSYKGAIPSIIKASRQWNGNDDELWNMQRWLSDVYCSIHHTQNNNNHVLINYDDFVVDRKDVVSKLNQYLGLQIQNISDEELANKAKLIVEQNEKWKVNNLEGCRAKKNDDMNISHTLDPFIDYLKKLK